MSCARAWDALYTRIRENNCTAVMDSKPHLIYAIQDFDSSGAMRAPYLVLKGFAQANWDVEILTTASARNEQLDCVWGIVPVTRVHGGGRRGKLLRLAARLFLRPRSTVVMSFIWDWHCFALALAKVLAGKPYVVALDTYIHQSSEDDARFLARLWREVRYGWVLRRADIVLAEAPVSFESAQRARPGGQTFLVPFSLWHHELKSIEDQWARENFSPTRAPVILYAGRFVARKQIPNLIDAFHHLAGEFPEWQLELRMLGGDASEIARIKEMINTTGLKTRITILPALESSALYRRYREISIVALPSQGEGMPTGITEAMYFCGAIVAGHSGFVPYQLAGKSGLLYPPGDVAALTAHLRMLMSSSGTRAQFTEKARNRMIYLFTWEKYFPMLQEKFRALADAAP